MSKYTDIFFDLDRTIWDFDKNTSETLIEMFSEHQLAEELNTNVETFISTFRKVNDEVWAEFKKGEKSKEDMRVERFVYTFFQLGSNDWKKARKLNDQYLETSPYKPHLLEGSHETLMYLKQHFRLHIISNGFSDTQRIKIKSSGIEEYFDQIIISDETPFRKPQSGIFKWALEKASAEAHKSLMVGDDWQKDILGAKNAKIDQAYIEKERTFIRKNQPTFQIEKIGELKEILSKR